MVEVVSTNFLQIPSKIVAPPNDKFQVYAGYVKGDFMLWKTQKTASKSVNN